MPLSPDYEGARQTTVYNKRGKPKLGYRVSAKNNIKYKKKIKKYIVFTVQIFSPLIYPRSI